MKKSSGMARWLHLLHLEAEIDRCIADKTLGFENLRVCLESAEEVFAEHGDPIKNFPSYALLRFCRKLREGLELTQRSSSLQERPDLKP